MTVDLAIWTDRRDDGNRSAMTRTAATWPRHRARKRLRRRKKSSLRRHPVEATP